MSRALERLGRFAARRPWVVIASWLAMCLLVIACAAGFGRELEDPFEAPGLDSHAAGELLAEAGDDDMGLGADVVLTPVEDGEGFFASPESRSEVAQVQAALAALPNVLGVSDPAGVLDQGTEEAVRSGVVSPNGQVALIRVQYLERKDLSARDLERLEMLLDDLREDTSLQIEAGGDLHFAFEEPPAGLAEALGLLAAVVILLFAFGSVVAMGLPIGTALLGLAVGAGSLSLVAFVVDIPAWATVIGAMVGLGVGIDYSLFVLTRFREHLAEGRSVEDAVGLSLATAGRSVVFAGGTVVVALLGLAVARIPFVTAGGIGISWIVLVMVLASITLLPALLGLAGHRVNGRRPLRAEGVSGRWRRWGAHVGRHAVAYALGATVLLVALAAPVAALRLGFPDEGTMPQSRTERRAYDLIESGFGPGANGPLVIAVDVAGDPGVLEPLSEAIAADPGIAAVAPARLSGEGIAVLVAEPTTSPQAEATRDTIARLRTDVLADVLADSPARAHVGGQVAVFADLGDRVQERLPWFVASVVLLSVVLLLVMFRSVIVPIKAAVMNILSVGAAYGVLVMVFQWGWGAELIGVESTVPILSFIPLFMFAILFGLSMDYEVFLLSRIREEYVRTGDNDEAVVSGLATTARTITSAALIMVAVFGSFVLGADPLAKMLGLGLATAIAIDATIVRLILLPATMKLLGHANWWLPSWLDTVVPGGRPATEITDPAEADDRLTTVAG